MGQVRTAHDRASRTAAISRAGAGRRRRPGGMGGRGGSPEKVQPVMATQAGCGARLTELGRTRSAIAARGVTASPDVTVSTNLGAWVNRRGLFAREKMADTFKSERI